MNEEHAANLTAAISDLKRRRQEIDDAIASMETILATVYGVKAVPAGVAEVTASSSDVRMPRARSGSRAEKVRRAFTDQPTAVWTAEKLAVEIGEEPDEATVKAVYGILSRLNKAGLVHKIGRGEYSFTDAPGPAEARPGSDTTMMGLGGDPVAPREDHGDGLEQRNRDHRGGTSVVEDHLS